MATNRLGRRPLTALPSFQLSCRWTSVQFMLELFLLSAGLPNVWILKMAKETLSAVYLYLDKFQ